MSSTELSTEDKLEGSIVNVIYVDASGTDPSRTVLALATKDDLSVTIDESTESFDKAIRRRTERIRTANEIDIEVSQAVSTDHSGLQKVGLVDSDGKLVFDDESRDLGSDEYIELAYSSSEIDYTTDPGPADFAQVHRAGDVEIMAGDIDPSSTPPTISFTVMVEGDLELDASAL